MSRPTCVDCKIKPCRSKGSYLSKRTGVKVKRYASRCELCHIKKYSVNKNYPRGKYKYKAFKEKACSFCGGS